MNEMGLSGKRKKQKYHSYLGEVGRIAENLINRNFISDGQIKNGQLMYHSSTVHLVKLIFLQFLIWVWEILLRGIYHCLLI